MREQEGTLERERVTERKNTYEREEVREREGRESTFEREQGMCEK